MWRGLAAGAARSARVVKGGEDCKAKGCEGRKGGKGGMGGKGCENCEGRPERSARSMAAGRSHCAGCEASNSKPASLTD